MAKREKDTRIELTGYSLLEHYEKRALDFLKKQIDNGNEPLFSLLTSHGTGISDNDLALRINKAYKEINIRPINARKVQQVRYGLVDERKQWLVLRDEMTNYGYCDPAPSGLI